MSSKKDYKPGPVLLLDDDPHFRALLKEILSKAGYAIVEASTAKEADRALKRHHPMLAIVDYQLPGKDGITWIADLRATGLNIPIVYLSALWCDLETFNRLHNLLGVTLILQKPIVPELFLEQIQTVMPADNRDLKERKPANDAARGELEDLRHLFKHDALREGSSKKAISNAPSTRSVFAAAQATDMHISGSFRAISPQTNVESKHEPDCVPDEEAVLLDQLVQFRQKLQVEKTINAARAGYAKMLPAHVLELGSALKQLKSQPGNLNAQEEIIQQVHRLRGTAGSFGFQQVSSLAGAFENCALKSFAAVQSATNNWERLDDLLAQCGMAAEICAFLNQSNQERPQYMIPDKVLMIGRYGTFAELIRELATTYTAEALFFEALESIPSELRCQCIFVDLAAFSTQGGSLHAIKCLRNQSTLSNVPIFLLTFDQKLSESDLLLAGVEQQFVAQGNSALIKLELERLFSKHTVKPKVLAVDDDEVLTNFITSVLSSYNIEVTALKQPIAVLEVMEKVQPDLVLLDVVMPGISGYDLCRMLRDSERWGKIPIIFLTAKGTPEARMAAHKAGADHFLAKPILTEELWMRVKEGLETPLLLRERREVEPTSGLYTCKAFKTKLEELFKQSKKERHNLVLALIAIEHFSAIASQAGAFVQEQIAQEFGQLLNERFRAQDSRAHFNEGVFALALSRVDLKVAETALSLLAAEFADWPEGKKGVENLSQDEIRTGSIRPRKLYGQKLLKTVEEKL